VFMIGSLRTTRTESIVLGATTKPGDYTNYEAEAAAKRGVPAVVVSEMAILQQLSPRAKMIA
jgi:hypothetical protein